MRRDDRWAAPLGEELIKRQSEASLAPVGRNGRRGVVGVHEGCNGGGADAPGSGLIGKLALPALEAGGRTAALAALAVLTISTANPNASRAIIFNCRLVIIPISFYGHDFGQPADVLYRPQ